MSTAIAAISRSMTNIALSLLLRRTRHRSDDC